MTDAGAVVHRHIEAFNAHDRDAEPWSATAEFVGPGGTISGREQVLDFLSVFWDAFPDGRLELKQLLADGAAAAGEGHSSALTTACCRRLGARLPRRASLSTFAGRRCIASRATSSPPSICSSTSLSCLAS
jgi:SnoaL-like domain